MTFHWICPHCNFAQTVAKEKFDADHVHIDIEDLSEGSSGFDYKAIGCSNPNCRKLTFSIVIGRDQYSADGIYRPRRDREWVNRRLLPPSKAKPQPEYIPPPIRQDYTEACLIGELSPKAAATLARRCIQGMIRDFAQVTGRTLFDEIANLRRAVEDRSAPAAVTIESVDAIDHVRSIGNIGAHMERDPDLIVDVDPDEAAALIGLIEMLFDEWYVARHNRKERLARITEIATQKQAERKGPTAASGDSGQGEAAEPTEQPSE